MADRAAEDQAANAGQGAMQPLTPRRVGEYDVLASLGRGGAGQVFLALRQGPHDFQKLVVLKLLHSHFEEDPEVVEMFLDEARLAGRLDHPNIAQTLEVGVADDRHFMVMGFLEGIGLDRLLATLGERHERLPPPLCAFIAGEVLAGLHYAHELEDHDGTPLRVVHRDVSPSNVFLCWDGTVKLIDFGIAKAAIRRANTDSGVIKGKWSYIAPEHATGEGTDRRADVWSTGVVLWEMLTGKRLFPNLNDVTTLQALVAGELQSLEEHAPETPEALAAVVKGALRQEPEDRYPSAAAMNVDLRTYLAELSRPVRREDVADLLGDLFEGERERQQVLLAELVGGALAVSRTGSFGVSTARPPAMAPATPKEEEPPPGWRLPLLLAAAAVATLTMIAVGGALDDDTTGAAEARTLDESSAGGSDSDSESPPAADSEPGPASASDSTSASDSELEAQDSELEAQDSELDAQDPELDARDPERGTRDSASGSEPESASDSDSPPATGPSLEPPPGRLSIDTIPWSEVHLGDRRLGTTPLTDVELPAGEHELTFVNPEAGIRRAYTVRVVAGESTRRRVPLR